MDGFVADYSQASDTPRMLVTYLVNGERLWTIEAALSGALVFAAILAIGEGTMWLRRWRRKRRLKRV